MAENKKHWYDGWIYDKFIAPNQDKMFRNIKKYIKLNSKILDVGCGTGRFSFSVADICEFVVGIDLSEKNIEIANKNLSEKQIANISFQHIGLGDFVSKFNNYYDYAVLSFVIHEVPEFERINLLLELSKVTNKIIIGDYIVPIKKNLSYWLTTVVEFFAGKEHFRNYKNYIENGGIRYLVDKAGLKIIHKINNHNSFNEIMVLSEQ